MVLHVWQVLGVKEDSSKLALETFALMELNPDAKMSRDEFMKAVKEFFTGENRESPYRFLWGPLPELESIEGSEKPAGKPIPSSTSARSKFCALM